MSQSIAPPSPPPKAAKPDRDIKDMAGGALINFVGKLGFVIGY